MVSLHFIKLHVCSLSCLPPSLPPSLPGPAIEEAIREYARREREGGKEAMAPVTPYTLGHGSSQREFIDQSTVIVETCDSLVAQEHFATLEDSQSSPEQVKMLAPLQVIRWRDCKGFPPSLPSLLPPLIPPSPEPHSPTPAIACMIWPVSCMLTYFTS